ncbi:uncharacterized protein LOC117822051 isoform X2 [Notolabrus celidotus]|uniref:uncharacterized protein LOC117822051 isoform X2 n=1 Tax=Notolabrus celidotus TaxID=1203425 RepID=UPI0014903D30|nr:uncharacterized protein LOC117822051 isoform X2 [Notolabrus celidotus]
MRKVKSVIHVHSTQQEERSIRTMPLQQKACTVWIVGDSYVQRGFKHARETLGTNLGLSARIQWIGRGGMCWDGMLPIFRQFLRGREAPDVLVIHCGGNDLGCVKSVLLLKAMKRDLDELHRQFPQMNIMLSSINQRLHWRHSSAVKIEKVRRFVNRAMASYVRTISHPHIVYNKPELYLLDNVHLSSKGSDIFWNAIAQALKDLLL